MVDFDDEANREFVSDSVVTILFSNDLRMIKCVLDTRVKTNLDEIYFK